MASSAPTASSGLQSSADNDSEVAKVLNGSSPWQILGLKKAKVEPSELRKAYLRKSLLVHPDKNGSADAHAAFLKLSEAYDKLSRSSASFRSSSSSQRGHQESDAKRAKKQDEDKAWYRRMTLDEIEKMFAEEEQKLKKQLDISKQRRAEQKAKRRQRLDAQNARVQQGLNSLKEKYGIS